MRTLTPRGLAALAALALPLLAAPATAQQMRPGQHFVENWDYDGDGKVSLDEATERRGDIFTSFDENEDGVLTPEEYDAFDAARAADMENNQEANGGHGVGGGMMGYERSMTREVADTNADGVVTRDEFVTGTIGWFTMRDRDGDGFITLADFGPGRG